MKRSLLLPMLFIVSCCSFIKCGAQALPNLPNPAPPPVSETNGVRPATAPQPPTDGQPGGAAPGGYPGTAPNNNSAPAPQPQANGAAPATAGTPPSGNTGVDTNAVRPTPAPDDGSFKTTGNRTAPVASPTTAAAVTPTPQITPTPAQPTPVPTRAEPAATQAPPRAATPTVRAVPATTPANSYSQTSPLWKVGTVLLTLFGLALIIAFAPEFGPSPSSHTTVAAIGASLAAVALITDTFAGASPAASLAQCLLTLAGFGGLIVSGFLDSHRNRVGAGLMWLSASALLTHSLSHAADSAGTLSGGCAVIGAMLSFAYCAAAFLPGQAAVAADSTTNVDAALATPSRATAKPAGRAAPARGAAAKSAAKADVARLIAVEGTLKGRVFSLRQGANAVGKDAGALEGHKVHLAGDDLVSRIHALVMCDNNRCVLSDTGAASGIFLNGGRVLDDRDLMNGDRLQIGGTTFLYQRI